MPLLKDKSQAPSKANSRVTDLDGCSGRCQRANRNFMKLMPISVYPVACSEHEQVWAHRLLLQPQS